MDEYIRVETDLGPCVLEVGCPAPYGFAPSSCDDGATLLQGPAGQVFVKIYLASPTSDELEEFDRTLEARYILRDDGCGIWLLGFGNLPLLFDLYQNPHLYTHYLPENPGRHLVYWIKYGLWQFSVVDSISGLVKKIFVSTAPEDLRFAIMGAMTRALGNAAFTKIYKSFLNDHRSQSLLSLWDRATPAGVFMHAGSFNKIVVMQ